MTENESIFVSIEETLSFKTKTAEKIVIGIASWVAIVGMTFWVREIIYLVL